MSCTLKLSLVDSAANAKALKQLLEYIDDVKRKTDEVAHRLAEIGNGFAMEVFIEALQTYVGDPGFYNVEVKEYGNGQYAIVASGEVLVILEFGAGITYGKGHPKANEFGFGPGTYPGQTHALTGEGWYVPKSKVRPGASAKERHTYGNQPAMAMWEAALKMKDELEKVAKDVFSK